MRRSSSSRWAASCCASAANEASSGASSRAVPSSADGLLPVGVGLDDRRELAVPAAQRPGPVLIAVNSGIGQIPLELRVLGGKIGKPLKHRLPP